MRFFRLFLHGSGDEVILENEVVIGDVHLHCMTAKKEVGDGFRALKIFWHKLAAFIIELRVRIVAGDFNMALWQVVPELRARGVLVNLAAWYPWQAPHEQTVRIDSTLLRVP